jgi:hypothetical protein
MESEILNWRSVAAEHSAETNQSIDVDKIEALAYIHICPLRINGEKPSKRLTSSELQQ